MTFNHTLRQLRLMPILAVTAIFSAGCAAVQPKDDGLPTPLHTADNTLTPGSQYVIDIYDPLEGFNRRSYKFNYYFDRFVWLPAVNAYVFVTPNFVQDRLSNFVDNIFEFNNFTNNLLQGKFQRTGVTLTRFAINTTIGVLGLWDPATRFGLTRYKEDFGQTLGHYGVGNGPYIVLPIFGPSNLRDTTGLAVDTVTFTQLGPPAWVDDGGYVLIFTAVSALVERRASSFRYFQSGSPFEYETIRMLYTAKREIEIDR
jgi:phospholipid-binding lipoprotein MlaA